MSNYRVELNSDEMRVIVDALRRYEPDGPVDAVVAENAEDYLSTLIRDAS